MSPCFVRRKSTVIQLLEAFYRPTKGSVEFLGVDMKELNVKWIRNQIGLVGQEPDMFDLSIAENIRFGHLGATQEEIEEAAKQANAHDFIVEFPDGYDTQMGEKGTQVRFLYCCRMAQHNRAQQSLNLSL